MDINIKGDPGTGNTYQEINIQHVENFNPAATVVNNYYNGTRATTRKASDAADPAATVDIATIRQDILNYVSRLRSLLADAYKSSYMTLWDELLRVDVIAERVYNPGKQQGTNFNRNFVANIICYLGRRGFFGDRDAYIPSHFSMLLEGTIEHSVRAELARLPEEGIVSRLNRVLENRELTQTMK
ncbi:MULTISPECIES: hypothetical protein [unclassified Prevotella]|uniref:hypothetical protein n=1 Tax=unclassified Prevotella TaxID=2638335 RepID=UPI00048EABC6|nr:MULTISPECIES: hypothetical protein [unclassified Prevotella]